MLERDIDPQLTPEAWASIGKNMHASPESVRNNDQTNQFGIMSLLTCTVAASVASGGGEGGGIRLSERLALDNCDLFFG